VANRREIRISGFGGQGIVLAGVILARSAAIYNNTEATQSESHGAESRGGACLSDVVISDERVDYPMCLAPEVLVSMSPEAAIRYVPTIKPGGLFIIDEDLVPDPPKGEYSKMLKIPATRVAETEFKRVMANVVMLGALIGIDPLVKRESIEKAVMASAPKGTEEMNLAALRKGFELGEAALKA
jgi:2-oxoglutarate ferredoxin oxidoreductase subunit gamma